MQNLSLFRLPNSGPRNAGNCILESPILPISRGRGMPPNPPRSSCLRHSTFAPAARTVHVRQLNHSIRYFQMIPKTLALCKMASQTSWYRCSHTVEFVYLTLTSKSIRFSLFGWSGSYQKSKGKMKVTKS